MVPTEYRLEQVTARLAERLESTRRSYSGDPDKAAAEFRRIADDLLDDVIGEFRVNGFTDHPERHEQFLRQEVLETFLPRYTRMATDMTAKEDAGYGLGFLYGPLGRLLIGAVSLALIFVVLRMPAPSYKFAMLPALLASILLPDVVSWLVRRRYRRDLVAMFHDMSTIQDRAGDYLPGDAEAIADQASAEAPATESEAPPGSQDVGSRDAARRASAEQKLRG